MLIYTNIPSNKNLRIVDDSRRFSRCFLRYLRRPKDIPTDKHFYGTFGNYETEASARLIIKFCQKRNSWKLFTQHKINKFVGRDFKFDNLLNYLWITSKLIGQSKSKEYFYITEGFIDHCYNEVPAARGTYAL